MDKTNFILYKDSKEVINLLSDEQAGKLFKAIFNYVEDRTELETKDGMLKIAFAQIKVTLERDLIKYKKTVERNRENGKKGGRPSNKGKKTHSVNNNPNNPSGLKENPTKPKKADSDNDNGIDSDIDNDKDKKKTRRFIRPSIEELEDYCKEKNYKIDCTYFFNHYESNGWKVGRNSMKSWKATLSTWNARNQKDTTPTESAKSKAIRENLFGGTKYAN